jgi:hypothetical protein
VSQIIASDVEYYRFVCMLPFLYLPIVPLISKYAGEGIMGWWKLPVNSFHHFGIGMGAGNRQHPGMGFAHARLILAQASSHDHLAVLFQGLADRLQ